MSDTHPTIQFELSSGTFYAGNDYISLIEAGQGPLNLNQLFKMGKLLVGDSAILEPDPNATPQDIIPLPELLLDSKHQHHQKIADADYGRLDVSEWTPDDYLEYGRWLDSFTRTTDSLTTRLSQEMLKRAYRLCAGPSIGQIGRADSRFKPVTAYYTALEIVPQLNAYVSWKPQDFANYVEGIFVELLEATNGEQGAMVPLNEEVDRRAKLGLGPSVEVLRKHGGYPMQHMVLNGYVDVENMTLDDYVKWGVRFMKANDGKPPTRDAINLLSRTRRAPNANTVLKKFRWGVFLSKVGASYVQQRGAAIVRRVPAINQEMMNGKLPPDILHDIPAEKIITVRATWLLVNRLLPCLAPAHKRVIARHVEPSELIEVLKYTGDINDDDITESAANLGIVQDLWPPIKEPYLRVPEELLA